MLPIRDVEGGNAVRFGVGARSARGRVGHLGTMRSAKRGPERVPERGPERGSRWMRGARWALVALAVLALFAWLLGPGLLRLGAERVLSWKLEGEVTLDRVRVLGRRRFL